MELGLGFDDDDLCVEDKEVKQPLKSYNAKICHTKWFLTAEGEDNESRSNISKYQADYYYGQQQYQLAVSCYKDGMATLSSQNRVMRKEMMESLARCYAYLEDRENAFNIVTELMTDVPTTDNMVQVLMLKQQILNMFGMLQDEIEVIQQLIGYHPYNAQFWLMLMKAYKQILSSSDSINSNNIKNDKLYSLDKTEKYPLDIGNSNECSLKHDLEANLEKTLTLSGSRSQVGGHLESCVNYSENSNTCQCSCNSTMLSEAHDKAGNREIEKADQLSSATVAVSRSYNEQKNCLCTETAQCSICRCAGHGTNCSACDKVSEEKNVKCNDKPSESTSHICAICHHSNETDIKNGIQEEAKPISSSNSSYRISENGSPAQLMLLTCCIRARLLLSSVHGTVGSFIKARNQEHLSQVDNEIQELCLDESIVQAATEFMMKDLYQTPEEETEDSSSSPTLCIKTVNTSSTDEFDEKWFAWVKNI